MTANLKVSIAIELEDVLLLSTPDAFLDVLQCLLHMPQVEFALGVEESTAKDQKLDKFWGICSKHCNTVCLTIVWQLLSLRGSLKDIAALVYRHA